MHTCFHGCQRSQLGDSCSSRLSEGSTLATPQERYACAFASVESTLPYFESCTQSVQLTVCTTNMAPATFKTSVFNCRCLCEAPVCWAVRQDCVRMACLFRCQPDFSPTLLLLDFLLPGQAALKPLHFVLLLCRVAMFSSTPPCLGR